MKKLNSNHVVDDMQTLTLNSSNSSLRISRARSSVSSSDNSINDVTDLNNALTSQSKLEVKNKDKQLIAKNTALILPTVKNNEKSPLEVNQENKIR